jgi:hypothetical protein
MEEIAMRMGFDDSRDAFYGSLETLSENRDKAVALLALALNKPRFDVDAVDRIRGQLQAGLIPQPRAIPTGSPPRRGRRRRSPVTPMAARPTVRPSR